MTIDEWKLIEIKRVENFVKWYKFQSSVDSNVFKEEMELGDWNDTYYECHG